MATRTNDSTPPDPSTLPSSLADALAEADGVAAARIRQAQMVYLARASERSRAAEALKAQFGADDAGVLRAESAVSSVRAAGAQIGMLHQRLTTPDPLVA